MKLNWDTEIPSDFIKERNDLLKKMIIFTTGQARRCVCLGQILKNPLMYLSIIEFRKSKGYQTNFHGAYRESENNPSNLLTKMGFPLSQSKEKKYGGRELTFSRNTTID